MINRYTFIVPFEVASREATSGRPELVIVTDVPSAVGVCPTFAPRVSLGAASRRLRLLHDRRADGSKLYWAERRP